MKVASITITSSRRDMVQDAIKSVRGFVDVAIIVDMGIKDDTIQVISDLMGGRIHVIKPKSKLDIAGYRNFGLDAAHEIGADWAVTLDTDERIVTGVHNVKKLLESRDEDILLVRAQINDKGSTYHKERFFRIPVKDRFKRDVHECVIPNNSKVGILDELQFSEIPKTGKEFAKKMAFVVKSLTKELDQNPNESRSWFYLGDALYGQGKLDQSLNAFRKCAELSKWDEESSWALMRMATIFEAKGELENAIACCAAGLAKHAGIPELAFYASILNMGLGKIDQAIYWARMAVVNGNLGGERAIRLRTAWRIDYAMGRGPWEVLRDCYKAIGWEEEELKCIRMLEPLAQ